MSTAAQQSRFRTGRRVGSACGAPLAAVLVGLLTMVLGASPASAYWSSTGVGVGSGQTDTLAAATNINVAGQAITDVQVGWSAGAGGVPPAGYYVTRLAGASPTDACGSNPGTLLIATSCLDPDVPDGDYTYIVTAVYRTWTAVSAPSSTVTVVNPAQLDYLSPPTTTTAAKPFNPTVEVRLLSAAGNPVALAGVPITLAIGTNPAAGFLAGTITVLTAADGTATFDTLSISRPGVGYTLVATSPGLASATSAAFTVLPPPPLGEASSYSVLGGAGVVNTLGSNVSGDLGTGPGFVATGFGPGGGTVGGDIHLGDAHAVRALADAATAYTALRALPATGEVSGNLGGLTLGPGVYHSGAALGVTGILTLNGGPNDVFVFQVDAALNTAAADQVVLTGGAQAANVYWVVNGAAGLGAGTLFKGTILARGAITLGLATELIGRAFATGAVTMANNTIRFTKELPPTLTISGGATVVTKDTTPLVSGTTDAPAGTIVTVTVGGQTLTTTVQVGGSWAVTATSLPASSYVVAAQVRDAAGNASRASQTMVVEVNPDPVDLGAAASFSVLAAGTVTSGGPTHLSGDLGVTGLLSQITADPPITVDGTTHFKDPTALAAQSDLSAAITETHGRTLHTQLPDELGGHTFHVGVHRSLAAVGLTGIVTLDGEGDENARFIFQVNGALTAAASCQVNLVNGAQASNVFWVVKGAAGTGASCSFQGNLLTTGAITLGASTTLVGRALSQAAVTLASNDITGVTPPAARQARGVPALTSAPSPSTSVEHAPSPANAPEPTPDPSPTSDPSPTNQPEPTPDPSPTDQPGPTASGEASTTPTPTGTP